MSSNWIEDSVNNQGFANGANEVVNPTPPNWGLQETGNSDTSLLLSDGWTVDVDGTLLDLTFKYNNVSFFSINDNGTLGLLQHTDLPSSADVGSVAMKNSNLYIYQEDNS